MSEFTNDVSDTRGTNVGHYPEATIVSHLKGCQKITLEHSRTLFDSFASALDEKLLEFVDKAKSNEEARQLLEISRLLRRNRDGLRQRFAGCLGEGFVKFKQGRLNTQTGEEKYRSDMLSLVDNEDLEETIALSSIANRTGEAFGEELWSLNQRLAVLNQGVKVRDSNNPVSPLQFCEALRKTLINPALSTKSKIIAYKVFDVELSGSLGRVLEDVNAYLAQQGILSNLRYSVGGAMPFGSSPAESTSAEMGQGEQAVEQQAPAGDPKPLFDRDQSGPAHDQYQQGMIQAIRTLQHFLSDAGAPVPAARPTWASQPQPPSYSAPAPGSAAAPGPAPGLSAPVYSNQQLVSALQTLQMQAFSVSGSAANVPVTAGPGSLAPQNIALAGQQLVAQLKEESEDGRVDPDDMQTIDLVGMLFEYMLSDEQLPDSVKALLSYLHTPFLKIAFIDATFFEKAEHPARLLLNNLAEAGTRWVSNDGTAQYEMYDKIKETVSRVLEEFENDVRIFAELLLDFSSYVKKIARRQDLMEKRAMEKAQGEEKLREVKIRVNQEVRSRTDGKDLPSAVLLLLLQPWSDYLAFLLLRYGEKSESWKNALRAVDDIISSINTAIEVKDKSQHLEMLDELLEVIETGFETIGYDQGKAKKLIEALVSLQKMVLQSKKPAPAPAPVRTKLETEAAEKAGRDEELNQKITPEEQKMVENLKMIEFGTWFEFEGGKRLKVAWYNSKTMQYMLVDQMGKKVAMRSGLELARGMLSGKAKVIAGSSKPFFERALENILQNLNARAEAIQPETHNG
ncbi:DUF1631 domain-containing protein [Proteobacteria bacterium 005FR1]|nr:DUF1631 domain-containing protein [Proteobacteria bacterium 005FR1]